MAPVSSQVPSTPHHFSQLLSCPHVISLFTMSFIFVSILCVSFTCPHLPHLSSHAIYFSLFLPLSILQTSHYPPHISPSHPSPSISHPWTPPVRHWLADPGERGVPGCGVSVPARAAKCPGWCDLPCAAWREVGHRGPHGLRQVFPVVGALPAAGAQFRASAAGWSGHQPTGAG